MRDLSMVSQSIMMILSDLVLLERHHWTNTLSLARSLACSLIDGYEEQPRATDDRTYIDSLLSSRIRYYVWIGLIFLSVPRPLTNRGEENERKKKEMLSIIIIVVLHLAVSKSKESILLDLLLVSFTQMFAVD